MCSSFSKTKTSLLGTFMVMMFVSAGFAQKIDIVKPVGLTTYNVVNSAKTFQVTKTLKTTTTLGTGGVQACIDLIRADAAGKSVIISFGTEGKGKLTPTIPLDIGAAGITFDGGANKTAWGTIFLQGSITSKSGDDGVPTITMLNGVSVSSGANVTNNGVEEGYAFSNRSTGTLTITGGTISIYANYYGSAISNSSTGTVNITGGTIKNMVEQTNGGRNAHGVYNSTAGEVNISGGTISVTNSAAGVYNSGTGAINISGGTVKAVGNSGVAVYNMSTGKVTVSGNAIVTSENKNQAEGTVFLNNASITATTARLEVKGGTVENTNSSGSYGSAICNETNGAINISGGTVQAKTGHTIKNNKTGAINISGGTVQATEVGYAIGNKTGKITVSGDALITSANMLGTIIFDGETSEDVFVMTGGTVRNTQTQELLGGCAVYNLYKGGITITGGTLQGRSFSVSTMGKVTLGGNPTIIASLGYSLGNLSLVTSGTNAFAPDEGKVYTLYFNTSPKPAVGSVAVTGGAPFINNFHVRNDAWGFNASGNNLVLKEMLVYYITAVGVVRKGSATATPLELDSKPIIDVIAADAKGEPCIIYFGNGTSTLDIGQATVNFKADLNFGSVTLKGKLKQTNVLNPAITVSGAVSINSSADIESDGIGFKHSGSGTLTISGGALKNTVPNYSVISNESTGAVNITAGTLSPNSGYAVHSISTGKISVSGDAVLTSSAANQAPTILLDKPVTDNTNIRLEISGGTVTNTASISGSVYPMAIQNKSAGAVIISDGEITSKGHTIVNSSTGSLTVNGGTVSTTGGVAIYNDDAGAVNIGGDAKVKATSDYGSAVVSNFDATVTFGGNAEVSATNGTALFNFGDGNVVIEGSAVITSAKDNLEEGTIVLDNSARLEMRGGHVINTVDNGSAIVSYSKGAMVISGGTVENTMDGVAVYNIGEGEVIISGGTLKSADGAAIQNDNNGEITISGGDISGGSEALVNYGTAQVTVSGSAHLRTTSSSGDAIYNNGGLIRIAGGTVEATQYAVHNNHLSTSASIDLGGDPLVIGGLRYSAGKLGIIDDDSDDDFAPSGGSTYTLALSGTPAAGDFAVVGGAEFINNFQLSGSSALGLIVNGKNIVLAQAYTITVNAAGNGTASASLTSSAAGREITLTAMPDPGYRFDKWVGNDGLTVTNNAFTMPAKAVTVTAVFDLAPVFAVTVTGGTGSGDYEEGELVTITAAAPPEGKVFDKWTGTDGVTFGSDTSASTTFEMLAKAVTVTATYKIPSSIRDGRRDPVQPSGGGPLFAAVQAGEFTAGPNPSAKAEGKMNFFWQGGRLENATLSVYDASGNLIKKVKISDKVNSQAKRTVGSWDLKDSKGRAVSEGSYVVKGAIKTKDGKKEKISLVLGVR